MTFEVSAGRAVTPQEEQIGACPTSASSPSLTRVIIPGERVRRRSASNARVTRNAGSGACCVGALGERVVDGARQLVVQPQRFRMELRSRVRYVECSAQFS